MSGIELLGFDAIEILSALAAVSAALVTMVLGSLLLGRTPRARMRRVVEARGGAPAGRGERAALARRFWRGLSGWSALKGALDARLRERLDQAGLRGAEAANAYILAKVAAPLAGGGLMMLCAPALGLSGKGFVPDLLVALLGVMAGFYGPDIYLANGAIKRRDALQKGVPDALDLMVICAEAGSSLDAAIQRVAREIGASYPELGQELGTTAAELGFLPDRRMALENLVRRTGLPALRSVVATLQQAEKYGTPLGQSLRVLANEYRNERMLKAEAKAARLPATLTVPLICFVMPALFVVLIGPAIIRAIDQFTNTNF
ncbi:type II secretion system F family protein [Arenibaculum pallidiluteum]|uniref:type II secretion system F family protein n=1 Tax=Arenibaculum pallidiluteum TaxID=2812559 RepID=UPI001A96C8AF|nr:type II secretion system F family protein [Arenibaculum pallidiluteum]